jgi:hypothetical protein
VKLGEAVQHQIEPIVPRKIRAGAGRLIPASLREESREVQESCHLPNDFMKNDEFASILMWNQRPIQGNRTKAKPRIWTLEFSFLMLLHSQLIH